MYMYMCVRGHDFASVSKIFRLDIGTVLTVWWCIVNFALLVIRGNFI